MEGRKEGAKEKSGQMKESPNSLRWREGGTGKEREGGKEGVKEPSSN